MLRTAGGILLAFAILAYLPLLIELASLVLRYVLMALAIGIPALIVGQINGGLGLCVAIIGVLILAVRSFNRAYKENPEFEIDGLIDGMRYILFMLSVLCLPIVGFAIQMHVLALLFVYAAFPLGLTAIVIWDRRRHRAQKLTTAQYLPDSMFGPVYCPAAPSPAEWWEAAPSKQTARPLTARREDRWPT
jgi:hypothetical protein